MKSLFLYYLFICFSCLAVEEKKETGKISFGKRDGECPFGLCFCLLWLIMK